MKVLIILSGLLAISLAQQQNNEEYVKQYLVGNWKENQYERTNLNNFLYEMGKTSFYMFQIEKMIWSFNPKNVWHRIELVQEDLRHQRQLGK